MDAYTAATVVAGDEWTLSHVCGRAHSGYVNHPGDFTVERATTLAFHGSICTCNRTCDGAVDCAGGHAAPTVSN